MKLAMDTQIFINIFCKQIEQLLWVGDKTELLTTLYLPGTKTLIFPSSAAGVGTFGVEMLPQEAGE